MKEGKCIKCGCVGKVMMHHTKGYDGEHKDEVYPYCPSCHKIVHLESRKSGLCKIPVNDLKRKSQKSYIRRDRRENRKQLQFYTPMEPNVRLRESVYAWKNKTRIECVSCFIPSNGKKLYEVIVE